MPHETFLFMIDNQTPEATSNFRYQDLTCHYWMTSVSLQMTDVEGELYWVNDREIVHSNPMAFYPSEWTYRINADDPQRNILEPTCGIVDTGYVILKKNLGATFVSNSGLFVAQYTATTGLGHVQKIEKSIGSDPVLSFSL